MSEELEIKYNPKKIKEFWAKYNVTLLLLLIIPIALAGYFRAYPYELPISQDWAEQTITNNIQNQIANNIIQQYPNIDSKTLDTLVTQQTNLYLKENKDQISAQKEQLATQIKANFQDDSGQTYLLAIDPYYYYRQAKNILDNGNVGDETIDGKFFDNHMLAPNGEFTGNSLHPMIIATIHRISQLFGNDSLLKSTFIVPMLIAMLSIIPCFFLGKRLGGNVAGSVAAVLLAIHPIFLGRTPAGFSDTDAYTILFPLLIVWLFFESLITKKRKNKLILGTLAGLSAGLFSYAWYGWWYIFDITLAAIGVYIIYLLIKNKKRFLKDKKIRGFLLSSITYIVSSAFFVLIFTNIKSLLLVVTGPLSSITLKDAAHTSLWPNVYTTVAELNEASLSGIISNLGGGILFALSILGIAAIFLKKKQREIRLKYFLVLAIWFIIALYASTKGMRFALLLLPPFVLGVGLAIGYLFIKLKKWLNKDLEVNKKLITTVFILALIAISIPWINKADNTAKNEVPNINDAWYISLTKIKEESQENAIINSWWDFGHWFKAVADRAVTFDGASQNTPQAHWIGKVLLTDNQDEAIAILRMLDCGGNDAYDILYEETNAPLITKRIIDKVLLSSESEARDLISEYSNNEEEILSKLFCDPPENYFITSEDMVSKSGVWAHFGSWNFNKSFAYTKVKTETKTKAIEAIKEKLGYTQEEAESTYRQLNGLTENEANQWIAPYPGYSNSGDCQEQNKTLICTNGVVIDLTKNEAYVRTNQGQIKVSKYRDATKLYETENGTSEISIAYMPEKSTTVLMQPELLYSMFTELYYYEGVNLKDHFELFDHQQGINGFDIYVWKIKW